MNTQTPGPLVIDDRHLHPVKGLAYPHGTEPETDVVCEINTDCHARGMLLPTDSANLRLLAAGFNLLDKTGRALGVDAAELGEGLDLVGLIRVARDYCNPLCDRQAVHDALRAALSTLPPSHP